MMYSLFHSYSPRDFRRSAGFRSFFCVSLLALCGGVSVACAENSSSGTSATSAVPSVAQPIVSFSENGKLLYRADERGNTIPDFSRAGYEGGGVALPVVAVVRTLEPQTERKDDLARIQRAIDEIAKLPADAGGHKGALLLKKGTYHFSSTLYVPGGVVLRGEGSGETDGTVLVATARERIGLIIVGDPAAEQPRSVIGSSPAHIGVSEIAGTRRAVTDSYVPWAAKTITLEHVDGLSAGDRVIVVRPATPQWLAGLGMDAIERTTPNSTRRLNNWKPEEYEFHLERFVVEVDPQSKRVTLDAPLMVALDETFGGGEFYKAQSVRQTQAGVESLRLIAEYEVGKERTDINRAQFGVAFNSVENAWAKDVTACHFNAGFSVRNTAIFVTILDCQVLDPVGPIRGGFRYGFSVRGQYTLVENGYTRNNRHAFATSFRTRGPNVFLNGRADISHTDSGPHERFAIGTLYDNITESKDLIVQNRGDWGTGQGWAGAQQVFWNCEVGGEIVVQQPPTAQNYAVGNIGKIGDGRFPEMPKGLFESHGTPVEPRSLYKAQLGERLGQ